MQLAGSAEQQGRRAAGQEDSRAGGQEGSRAGRQQGSRAGGWQTCSDSSLRKMLMAVLVGSHLKGCPSLSKCIS